MYEIQHEGDIINLIGYETTLKFTYMSDCIMTYKTINPIMVEGNYVDFEIEFFSEDDTASLEFFCYDSFSGFLSKYKIFSFNKINGVEQDVLYSRKYGE